MVYMLILMVRTALAAGAGQLKDGITAYTDGASKLSAGATQLKGGLSTYTAGVAQLAKGSDTLTTGIAGIYNRSI